METPAAKVVSINHRAIADAILNKLASENTGAVMRPHELPKLPPGVAPKRAPLAMDSASNNALFSYLNNGGGFCGLGFPGYPYLAELAQRSEYRAPIETIANEMTREWVKLKGADEEKLKELKQAMIDFSVREKFRLATIHDGEFGRGQIYINIKNQNTPNKRKLPLKVDPATIKKGSLVGFQNIEPMWTTPYAYNTSDPTEPDFYRPDLWYVMGVPTHADRLLTFIARPLPDMLKPSYNFGGLSLSQLTEPYVNRWLKVVDGVSRIITSFSITYIATDMQATLQDAGAADTLVQRARVFNLLRDNRGLGFINKDTEEFGQLNTPLSGLHELQAQAQEHMAAPTHIPLVFLTGITPSGLNASSDGEIKVFYSWIAGEQQNFYAGHLRTVLSLLQLHLWGAVDPDIDFEFVPLSKPTDAEAATIRKTDAEAISILVTGAIISADEGREKLRSDDKAGFTFLEGDAPAPALLEHELGEEKAELDAGRAEEAAQAEHERDIELERESAKLLPKGAQDAWVEANHSRRDDGKFGTGSQSARPGNVRVPGMGEISVPVSKTNTQRVNPSEGNRNTAHRIVTAENNFRETLMRSAPGITEAEAEKAMRTMLKLKVAKLDPIIGRIDVKHGAFLEPEAIRNAVAYVHKK
jgi:phage-related protein (TIGR01555 family)